MSIEKIRINHLEKSFAGNTILKDIDFHVSDGEVVVLIGPSGSGKSTLLRLMAGLEFPSSGSVIVDGTDITQQAGTGNIGMVFQQYNLFPNLSALENITLAPMKVLHMGKQEAFQQAMELLQQVGLHDRATYLPSQLSGGQQQRVAIARALAMRPSIMLFDEATSALDPELVGAVTSVMRDLANGGMTMVVVTHQMDFARQIADRVVFMSDGNIVEQGLPEQIFSHPIEPKTRQFLNLVSEAS